MIILYGSHCDRESRCILMDYELTAKRRVNHEKQPKQLDQNVRCVSKATNVSGRGTACRATQQRALSMGRKYVEENKTPKQP